MLMLTVATPLISSGIAIAFLLTWATETLRKREWAARIDEMDE